MFDVFEFGIIGMGPAGIGLAMSLHGTSEIKSAICFERGSYITDLNCTALTQNKCCDSKTCSIITGIGGASTLSSGKISDFPAGSGLIDFFDSEQQFRELLNEIVTFLSKSIALKKTEIDAADMERAKLFYGEKNINYKYYDVYEFDGRNYRDFIHKTVEALRTEGLQLYDNTEVIGVDRDPDTLCFRVKVKTPEGETLFFVRNLVLATGALDIQDRLVDQIVGVVNNCFEIGVRIEAPSNAFGNILSTHGDLKLKFGAGRTYCVTANGKIIAYQTGKLHFLEGCIDTSTSTGYTNLAILIKYNDDEAVWNFINQYRERFNGIPIKQRFVDYEKGQICTGDIRTTLNLAACGDINSLFPLDINNAIKDFIKEVLVSAMGVSEDVITLVAPELKILRNLQINRNFELDDKLFIIGAATGKFRGILQSLCSGIRCGQLLIKG
jgi:uncharacterized FAD-dependent dehydrogenase